MPISKISISSPLEAGPSLVTSQNLPPSILSALDYISSRLLRKHLHLTLIVVRNDIALPLTSSPPPPPQTPTLPPPTPRTPKTPVSPFFLRAISPTRATSPNRSSSTRTRSSSPASPRVLQETSLKRSTSAPTKCTAQKSNSYNLTLLHANTLSPKASRYLHEIVSKASAKFNLGDGWLSMPMTPTSTSTFSSPLSPTTPLSPMTPMTPISPFNLDSTLSSPTASPSLPHSDLITRSLHQNAVLFSAEGLTLLHLDRIYTFKHALSLYTRLFTSNPTCQETKNALAAALDELRLLILTQSGRRISKSYLLRAYDHLSISEKSLSAVNRAYRALTSEEGISGLAFEEEDLVGIEMILGNTSNTGRSSIQKPIVSEKRWAPKAPKLQIPSLTTSMPFSPSDEPASAISPTEGKVEGRWERVSIQRLNRGPHARGPVTPNGWEDVTPITRGSWNWFLKGRGPMLGAVGEVGGED